MRRLLALAFLTLLLPADTRVGATSDSVRRTITAHADIPSRTSLTVSTRVLQFTVASESDTAVAYVDFVAAVRTHAGAEVLLTVEASGRPEGHPHVTVSTAGEPTLTGSMLTSAPAVAGRWIGSGRRTGHLAFVLHGASAGVHTIPLRFVLSAP